MPRVGVACAMTRPRCSVLGLYVCDTRQHTPWTDFRSSISPHQNQCRYISNRVSLERSRRQLSENVPVGIGIVLGAE